MALVEVLVGSGSYEMSSVILWTFQSQAIVPLLESGNPYVASWERTPENWRTAYQWMTSQLNDATGGQWPSPPIWCWHSCNGDFGNPPTVGTASSLLCDYQIQKGVVSIELLVPPELMLLSSYYAWNKFLDFVIVHKRLPSSSLRNRWLLQSPLMKHKTDDVQAAIPCIKSEWIRGMKPVVIEGRQWNEVL